MILKMTRLFSGLVRLLALGAVLVLPACLGTGQGTRTSADEADGSVFSADAVGKTEAGPDVAYEDAKPHPGGVSAPLNEWEGDPKFFTVIRGDVSQCSETVHLANGTDVPLVKSRVNGRIVMVDLEDGAESPGFLCLGRYVRITEGGAESLQCTDILMKSDCTFQKEMEIADPGSVAFHRSEQSINFLDPKPHPACGPIVASEFKTLKSEFDFSGLNTESPPPCGQQSQQRMIIKPSKTIFNKLKNVLQ